MALSPEERLEMKNLARSINARNRARRTELEGKLAERIDLARREIERLVDSLREADPEIRRIVLFGSLARGEVKRIGFDIDLAIDSDRYLDLLDVALGSQFKVDLIDLPNASSYIRSAIDREGKEVFRAESK